MPETGPCRQVFIDMRAGMHVYADMLAKMDAVCRHVYTQVYMHVYTCAYMHVYTRF
jgi:hypothetical protein